MDVKRLGSSSERDAKVDTASQSLQRIQHFSPSDLVQKERFGQSSFDDAVAPAQKIIDLFKQLPISALSTLPDNELETIRRQADSANQLFSQVLEFDIDAGDVNNRRTQVIGQIESAYQGYFSHIYPLISYSIARNVDFNMLESQGRAAIQSIRDQTDQLMDEIAEQKAEASRILDEVRKTSAERGVSQEAFYFKGEADGHQAEAEKWRWWTVFMVVLVGLYGALTLFLHRVPFISPQNSYETVQLIASKIIVFVVLFYLLSICARSYLSNRHNEIVNRHRQNALMTYKSLVDAGGSPEARDVVLNHAAASVYQLHDTGFTKSVESAGNSSSSVIGLLPKQMLSGQSSQ